jgi:predicted nucleic acid-binding protein
MTGLMVDSSVWIDFFNRKATSPEKIKLQNWLKGQNRVYICPIVYQEVLQGVREENIFCKMKTLMRRFPMTDMDIVQATDYAIDMFRELQRCGITIRRSADCLIASYTIFGNMHLLHKDKDFTAIARVFPLKIAKVHDEDTPLSTSGIN